VSLLILAVSLLYGADRPRISQSHTLQEQSEFTAEHNQVNHPVKVPESVLQILGDDKHVANAIKTEGTGGPQPTADWFSASEIHLANQNEADIVEMG
jgi:hypothetical protein